MNPRDAHVTATSSHLSPSVAPFASRLRPRALNAASNASSDLEAGPSHGGGSSGGELVLPAEAHAANVAAANAKQRA
eukprot:2635665-Prymnesium_polylepis.1